MTGGFSFNGMPKGGYSQYQPLKDVENAALQKALGGQVEPWHTALMEDQARFTGNVPGTLSKKA